MTPTGLDQHKQEMDLIFGDGKNGLTKKGNGESSTPNGGVIYNIAFTGYYNLNKVEDSQITVDDEGIPSIASSFKASVDKENMEREKKLQNDSHAFASMFADAINKCLKEVSIQIDEHIKSMIINIMAQTPGPSGTVLAGATGPVTGIIGANNLSPTGGISIT